MKKISFGLILMLSVMFASCNGCDTKSSNDATLDTTVVDKQVKLNFSQLVSTDRQDMFSNHGGDNYRWFETCMKLEDYLDAEGNDGKLEELVNVFQVVVERSSTSFDTKVFKFQHFANGTNVKDSIDGFWVEDYPLNDERIVLTYEQAFQKLMEANIVKPHSRYVTLRKQVGPIDANPQYIFGNVHQTVFVDAVTGAVSGINPAFPKPDDKEALGYAFNWLVSKGKGELDKPLGEWP